MRRVAFSFLNSVATRNFASLLISRATTEKSACYFSDSPFWFSGTMPSYCMTVLWRRRRRSKVHSSLNFFVLFCIAQRIFFIPWELSTGVERWPLSDILGKQAIIIANCKLIYAMPVTRATQVYELQSERTRVNYSANYDFNERANNSQLKVASLPNAN